MASAFHCTLLGRTLTFVDFTGVCLSRPLVQTPRSAGPCGGQLEAGERQLVSMWISISCALILTCGLAGGERPTCYSDLPGTAEAMAKAVPLPAATCFMPRSTSRQSMLILAYKVAPAGNLALHVSGWYVTQTGRAKNHQLKLSSDTLILLSDFRTSSLTLGCKGRASLSC